MPLRFAIASLLVSCAVGQTVVVSPGSVVGGRQPLPQQNPQPQQAQPHQEQQPPGSIEGSVTNGTTGEPLKRVNLMLMPAQPGPNMTPFSTSTDANGKFAMGNIAPGTYRMSADRNGFVRTEYGARAAARPGTMLTVSSGQALKQIELRMQPHSVIAGRVMDEDGEPLANVQVQVMMQRYMQGRRQLTPSGGGSTNDLGEYRVFGLAPGKYYVNAIHRAQMMNPGTVDRTASSNGAVQDEGYAPTYYPGTTDPSAAVPLQLAAGQPVSNIDLKLRRVSTVRVRGKVTGPVSQGRTMVMLMPQNDNMMSMGGPRNMGTTQGPDGAFEIRGVTPGSYHVFAQQADQTGQYSARVPVNVGNSNVDNIELVVRPGMEVSGRIRMEGEPQASPPQLTVMLQPKEIGPFANSGSGRVNADGTFTIKNVMPNTYRVAAGMSGQIGYVKSVLAGEQEVPDRELNITDGAPPTLTIVLSTAVANVVGSVTADTPAAAQGATVVLVPQADKRERNDLYRIATTDQYGKFTVKSVPPGEYTVLAWDNVEIGSWQDPEFLARFESKGKKITLKEKESATVDTPLLKVE